MFTRDFSSKDTMMRKIKDKSYFGVFTPILDKIVISVFFFQFLQFFLVYNYRTTVSVLDCINTGG